MDARTYLETFKDAGVAALVQAVNEARTRRSPPDKGTTVGYFKQIAYGHRRPSFELASDLATHDPQRQLDVVALMEARKPKAPAVGDGAAAA